MPVPGSMNPDLASVLRERFPDAVGVILQRFAEASASLRDLLAVAPLRDLLGATGEVNVQDEATAKLDDRANALFLEALRLPDVAQLISEEEPEPIQLGPGTYTCCFDPLDGSSNIGVASVGSVIGVYSGMPDASAPGFEVTGRQLVAAAFTVYGLPTMLILAGPGRADGFAFDPEDRSWRLVSPGLQTPAPKYASVNWMYRERWPAPVLAGVDGASWGLRGRYSGSMVEDILRVLMAGGVFLYPEDSTAPRGKLRMLYEVCPISFIMEAAGGDASDGARPILDVPITQPHQRGPLITGGREAVRRYREAYTGAGQ